MRQSINSFFTYFTMQPFSSFPTNFAETFSSRSPPIFTSRLRLQDPLFSLGVAVGCKLISNTAPRGQTKGLIRRVGCNKCAPNHCTFSLSLLSSGAIRSHPGHRSHRSHHHRSQPSKPSKLPSTPSKQPPKPLEPSTHGSHRRHHSHQSPQSSLDHSSSPAVHLLTFQQLLSSRHIIVSAQDWTKLRFKGCAKLLFCVCIHPRVCPKLTRA